MTIRQIAILSLPVRDQDASKRFYTEVLGFEVRRDNPMGPGRRWVEVAPKGAATSMTLVTWFEGMPAGSVDGLALDVADIDQTVRELRAKGVETGAVQSAPWGRFVTVDDPDGNGLVIQQTAVGA
jgi:catechol 2,3-dioxygenase-like lactoylglutathione lyase family enzyme